MNDIYVGLVCLVLTFGGAVAGNLFAGSLPDHHLSNETRATVSVSVAIVGTLSALVLGLMLSTANAAFSDRQDKIFKIAAEVAQTNDLLHRYGPESAAARDRLHNWVRAKTDQLRLPPPDPARSDRAIYALLEDVQEAILALVPKDARQQWLQARALELTHTIFEARWLLAENQESNIPQPFVYLVIFWLSLVFTSYGLCAPRNATAMATMFLSSVAVSGGITMILELDQPLSGLIRISVQPLHAALAHISP